MYSRNPAYDDVVIFLATTFWQGNKLLPKVAQAISDHADELDAWGIDWSDYRCGLSGCVFKIKNTEYLAKITGDESEYHLFQLANTGKGFVKVSHMQPLGDAFLIIKQKVTPLSDLWESDAYWDGVIASWTDFMHVYYQELNDVGQERKTLARAISNMRQHIRKHGPKEATDIFESLRKLAYRKIVLRDLDPDNIGVTAEGKLVIYDAQLAE